MEITSTSTIELIDLINLTKDIASLNAVYLTISVGIILTFGTAFYFFNFKPLQEKITKQEKNLELENKNIEKLKEELTNIIHNKITSGEKKIELLENLAKEEIVKIKNQANLIELLNLWDKKYLWTLGDLKVHENGLDVLIQYLEKSNEYKTSVVSPDLLFKTIYEILNKIKEKKFTSANKDDKENLRKRLINSLFKSADFDLEKRVELIKKAEDVLSDSK